MCKGIVSEGDLNPETRAFSPVLRLSTQRGRNPLFWGFMRPW
jgi:hypothetical protein